jgi:hypothetical protein
VTLIAAAIAVGLALPGTGLAADSQAPAPGSIQGVVGPAVQQASQTVQQASQTVQGAAAAASSTQASPVNVAVQIVISSPGASPVIVQTNANSSAAKASNASATKQDSPASQPASGGGSGGGSVQGVRQTSGTQQGAAAGAKAVQTNPVNVAIQIVKDSPGASPVIVQLNGNQADSQAANSSTTDQGSSALQAGSWGGPGPGSRLPAQSADSWPSPSPAELALPPPASPGDLGIDRDTLGGLPDLAWLWEAVGVDLPRSSWLSGFELSLLGWPFAGSADDEQAGGRGDQRGRTAGAAPHDRALQPAAGRDAGAFPGAPAAFDQLSASSSFVQTPAKARKDSSESAPRVPVPALPAPAGGGGGSASAGLLPVALATLIFWLTSLGLLFGRLSLASARWRHQAYLAPLQRPG